MGIFRRIGTRLEPGRGPGLAYIRLWGAPRLVKPAWGVTRSHPYISYFRSFRSSGPKELSIGLGCGSSLGRLPVSSWGQNDLALKLADDGIGNPRDFEPSHDILSRGWGKASRKVKCSVQPQRDAKQE